MRRVMAMTKATNNAAPEFVDEEFDVLQPPNEIGLSLLGATRETI